MSYQMNDAVMTAAEYFAEAERRFGFDRMAWRFVCPACGHVATPADWKAAGAPETAVAFSCLGRWTGAGSWAKGKPGPCDYAGAGLFRMNPVPVLHRVGGLVRVTAYFALAPRGEAAAAR